MNPVRLEVLTTMNSRARHLLTVASTGFLLAAGCGGDDARNEAEGARSSETNDTPRIAARGFEASTPRGWVRRDDLLEDLAPPPHGSPIAIIAPDTPGTVETYVQIYENSEAGGYDAASAVFGGSRDVREQACRQTGEAIAGSGAETDVLPVSTRPDDTMIAGCLLRLSTGSLQYRYSVLKNPVVYEVVGESQARDPEGVLKRPLDQLIKSVRIP
jgi:hypothetical protein